METCAVEADSDRERIGCPLSQGNPIEWKQEATPLKALPQILDVPSRRGTQLNGNTPVIGSRGMLSNSEVPSRRGTQLNGNLKWGQNLVAGSNGPLSQGNPIEWKPPLVGPRSGSLAPVPSRRGTQLNGNLTSGCCGMARPGGAVSPLSQGNPIEWKPVLRFAGGRGRAASPLSQGNPIEWKLGGETEHDLRLVKVPSRRGTQLNGNLLRMTGGGRVMINVSPLAGEPN